MRLHKMLWPRLLSDKLGLKADPGPETKAQRYADIFEGGRGQWIPDRAVPSSAFEEDHLIDWFRALCHVRLVFFDVDNEDGLWVERRSYVCRRLLAYIQFTGGNVVTDTKPYDIDTRIRSPCARELWIFPPPFTSEPSTGTVLGSRGSSGAWDKRYGATG